MDITNPKQETKVGKKEDDSTNSNNSPIVVTSKASITDTIDTITKNIQPPPTTTTTTTTTTPPTLNEIDPKLASEINSALLAADEALTVSKNTLSQKKKRSRISKELEDAVFRAKKASSEALKDAKELKEMVERQRLNRGDWQ